MGWHYILTIKCKILPEYIDFIKSDYLRGVMEYYSDNDNKTFVELSKIAHILIGNVLPVYKYSMDADGVFVYQISKRVNQHCHRGGCVGLHNDYLTFMRDVIVPISSEIMTCTIESDDYGQYMWKYTDFQLRHKFARYLLVPQYINDDILTQKLSRATQEIIMRE
jgi:hypothetical protein